MLPRSPRARSRADRDRDRERQRADWGEKTEARGETTRGRGGRAPPSSGVQNQFHESAESPFGGERRASAGPNRLVLPEVNGSTNKNQASPTASMTSPNNNHVPAQPAFGLNGVDDKHQKELAELELAVEAESRMDARLTRLERVSSYLFKDRVKGSEVQSIEARLSALEEQVSQTLREGRSGFEESRLGILCNQRFGNVERVLRDEQRRRVDEHNRLVEIVQRKVAELQESLADERDARLAAERLAKKAQREVQEAVALLQQQTAQNSNYLEDILKTEIKARMKTETKVGRSLQAGLKAAQENVAVLREDTTTTLTFLNDKIGRMDAAHIHAMEQTRTWLQQEVLRVEQQMVQLQFSNQLLHASAVQSGSQNMPSAATAGVVHPSGDGGLADTPLFQPLLLHPSPPTIPIIPKSLVSPQHAAHEALVTPSASSAPSVTSPSAMSSTTAPPTHNALVHSSSPVESSNRTGETRHDSGADAVSPAPHHRQQYSQLSQPAHTSPSLKPLPAVASSLNGVVAPMPGILLGSPAVGSSSNASAGAESPPIPPMLSARQGGVIRGKSVESLTNPLGKASGSVDGSDHRDDEEDDLMDDDEETYADDGFEAAETEDGDEDDNGVSSRLKTAPPRDRPLVSSSNWEKDADGENSGAQPPSTAQIETLDEQSSSSPQSNGTQDSPTELAAVSEPAALPSSSLPVTADAPTVQQPPTASAEQAVREQPTTASETVQAAQPPPVIEEDDTKANTIPANSAVVAFVESRAARRAGLAITALDPLAPKSFDHLAGQVSSVSCGLDHATCITANGQVWVWGSNAEGQLGGAAVSGALENADSVVVPTAAVTELPARDIRCGDRHTLLITKDGRVFSWGAGMMGVLGLGDERDRDRPTEIVIAGQKSKAVTAAAGPYNSAAIFSRESGPNSLYVWGAGADGQIGDGDRQPRMKPQRIRIRTADGLLESALSVSFGHRHAAVLTASGHVYTWGNNEFGQLGYIIDGKTCQTTPRQVALAAPCVMVACGERHTSAMDVNGAIFSWGSGETHQIGVFDNVDQPLPVQVAKLPKVISMAVGAQMSAAVTETGDVYAWGWSVETPVPKLLQELKDTLVVDIQIGANENIALMTAPSQNWYRWNYSEDTKVEQVDSLRGRRISALSSGQEHQAVVTMAGTLLTWGDNSKGQLGTGDDRSSEIPKLINITHRVADVACGASHTLALTEGGQILSWGDGTFGKLGHGSDKDVLIPTLINSLGKTKFQSIVCSQFNSGAVTKDGRLYLWGANGNGQIGRPDNLPRLTPVMVPVVGSQQQVETITAVALGDKHAMALSAKGCVYTWGDNEFGQCGRTNFNEEEDDEGDANDSDAPKAKVENVNAPKLLELGKLCSSAIVSVKCAPMTSFVISQNGELVTFGSGETNLLGTGSQDDCPIPTVVPFFKKGNILVKQVLPSTQNCIAISDSGKLYGWGFDMEDTPQEIKLSEAAGKQLSITSAGTTGFFFAT